MLLSIQVVNDIRLFENILFLAFENEILVIINLNSRRYLYMKIEV